MGGIQGRPPRDVCLASDSSEIGELPQLPLWFSSCNTRCEQITSALPLKGDQNKPWQIRKLRQPAISRALR